MIDIQRLVKPRQRGGKLIAQCPACAENGADRSAEHFVQYQDGRFGCIAYPGDKTHRARIIELVGGTEARPIAAPTIVRRGSPDLPTLETPKIGELSRLASSRGYPMLAGLELAVRAYHLFCATVRDGAEDVRVWLITDAARRNAQARRLDGKLWSTINAKAKTLKGSEAAWPIGAAGIGEKPIVALCEGGPDFLAAYLVAFWHGRQHEIAPVAMLGAGQRIHAEALPFFIGKRVLMFPHKDPAGQRAQGVWEKQLRDAGARWVEVFDCSPGKDLNDVVRNLADELEDFA